MSKASLTCPLSVRERWASSASRVSSRSRTRSGGWSRISPSASASREPVDVAVVDDPDLLPPPRRSFYQRHEALILGGTAVIVALVVWEALWEAGRISPL